MASTTQARQLDRARFDSVYDEFILNAGFFEPGDYYELSRERYWKTLGYLARARVPSPAKVLEIGGGQVAILAAKLFGDEATVADISDTYNAPVLGAGVGFEKCNLMEDDPPQFAGRFDVVVLAEVVEHLPIPPYVILSKVRKWLTPDGIVLITTPNLFRLRNLARMVLGRDLFDQFILPRPDVGLGHQTEYSAVHLDWQLREAGFAVECMEHDQLGQIGHSTKARLARRLLMPLLARKKWREELVAIGRNQASAS